jgi:hypothetical protein
MLTRNERRVMELALVLCAMGTMNACAAASRASEDLRVVYPLQVDNRSGFEVVVYAMATPTSRGQRLGTARPLGTTTLFVPQEALMSQQWLAVQLHAIGAPPSVPNWVSYQTIVKPNVMAQLDIFGDPTGNLRMSALTTRARVYR